jgi:hypothetical protein
MRLFLFLVMLAAGLAGRVYAQDGFVAQSGSALSYNVFDKDGRTFVNPAPDVSGSPFYKDEWRLGQLILNSNRKYDSIKVRLNLSSQEVHILDRNNTEVALARGYIREVIWPYGSKIRFLNGFPAVDNQDTSSFYAVLSEGKCWFLQSIRKVIVERKDELSGENKREYSTYEDYYTFDGKTMQRVKKGAVTIDGKEMKFKNIADLKKAIDAYNAL